MTCRDGRPNRCVRRTAESGIAVMSDFWERTANSEDQHWCASHNASIAREEKARKAAEAEAKRIPSMAELKAMAKTVHPHLLCLTVSRPSGVWLGCAGGNDWAELRLGRQESKRVMRLVLLALGAGK